MNVHFLSAHRTPAAECALSGRHSLKQESRLSSEQLIKKSDSIMPAYPVSMCLVCKYYIKAQRCEAFPSRIPQAILIGRYDHRKPYKGDRGIRFRPADDVKEDELKNILSIYNNDNL